MLVPGSVLEVHFREPAVGGVDFCNHDEQEAEKVGENEVKQEHFGEPPVLFLVESVDISVFDSFDSFETLG